MPSDAKKKAAARKKEASKNRNKKVETVTENGTSNDQTNGQTNSDASMLRIGSSASLTGMVRDLDGLELAAEHRAVTSVLASHPDSRDLHLNQLSITFHGAEILVDTKLEFNCGRRYGLLGANGSGKSTLLTSLGNRELPVPDHIDIFHLRREMPPSDKTALECVLEVDEERLKLEREAEKLACHESEQAHDMLMDLYEQLEAMDSAHAKVRAAEILHGLGFTAEMQNTAVKHFSGGWRMRISLSRALFLKPAMLLLDEPTNHLDLDACVWLEEELKKYPRILVIISHSQDFLNGVCTNIVAIQNKQLKYYGGNYDIYMRTRLEQETLQTKQYKWEQDQIAHMKEYIARFGHGSAKLARQAQSKEKTLKKMVDNGLTQRVTSESTLSFYFNDPGTIPPPVIMVQNVSFKYDELKPFIYKNLEFGVDLDSRVALVGPNGAGKSTLLKLIAGELIATDGLVRRHSHLKIGRYHQHLQEILEMDLSAIEWMMKQFPDIKEREDMRKIVGRYGLTGQQQTCPIKNLSDGQRCRIIFAWLSWQSPHMLLLDEPTNHLDMETIDALADAINDYSGGMLLVSHDFRLISQVAKEIWICEKQAVTKWNGDIFSYKAALVKRVMKANAKRMAAAN